MPLYINDPEVDRLVARLIAREKASKTEALRRVLRDAVLKTDRASSFASRKAAALKTIAEFQKIRGNLRAPGKQDTDSLYDYLERAGRGH